MKGLALARSVAAAMVVALAVLASGAPEGRAQARPEVTRPESADVVRRREELRDATTRLGDGARGLLTPLARLGYALLDDRRYEEAEQAFRRQLAVAERHFPGETIEVAFPLHHLGEVYRASRRCAEALPLYRQALAIREKRQGPDHVEIARSLHRMGQCQTNLIRYGEAEASLKAALAIMERVSGVDSAEAATVASDLGDHYVRTGRYPEGVEVMSRVVTIRETRFGSEDARLLTPLSRLGFALLDSGRFDEAEATFRRQLAIAEARFAGDTMDVQWGLYNLGEALRRTGRCEEAEPLHRRALEIREKRLGPGHELVGRALETVARCHASQGRYAAAEETFQRALAIMEASKGADSADFALTALAMADFYISAYRFQDAEPLLLRSLKIREEVYGPEDFRIPPVLNGLARTYRWTERFPQAEEVGKRALAIREKLFGADHEFTAYSADELGILYMVMGRFAESEQLKRRSLQTFERVFGPEHRQTGSGLASLAETYYTQGRHAEAIDMFRRAAEIIVKSSGPSHPHLVFPLRMIGQSYRRMGRTPEGIPFLARAVGVAEAAYGPDNRRVAQTIGSLARSLLETGRLGEAEPLLARALTINEAQLGADSVAVAFDKVNLARIKLRLGRHAEAETLAAQAVANLTRLRGAEDFETAWARIQLASALENQDRFEPALTELRQATRSFRTQMARSKDERSTANQAEQASYRGAFMDHVFLLWRAQAADAARSGVLTAEAFEVAQLAQATGTEAAVARMAARFASGTGGLAEVVRAREDTIERWRSKDAALVQFLGRPSAERDAAREAALRTELQQLDVRLKELDARIAKDYPDYASLASPQPVPLAEMQGLLARDEAVVLWLVGNRRTLVMAIRRDTAMFVRLDIGRQALNDAIRELRLGLDPSNVTSLQDIPRFDTTKAHELYKSIFAPIEPALSGARNVFIVPDAGLQSLPLGVLVSEAPEAPVADFSGYRQTQWLAKRYASTVLPSVGALKSLRRFARTARAPEPFLGIGDPTLEGPPGSSRGINVAALFARGAVADAAEIRKLPPLPETADELRAMARTLKVGEPNLYLGPRATERAVRGMDLQRYRVLAFATHGLMAGEFSDVGEPALVMTPPAQSSLEDDGVLTASEIAGLKLDADWVILSACNTAAADGTPGAEGLSGLARAFFYAGSRALLVSHWAVLSEATVKLTTTMLGEMAKDSSLGRAEAHRRAMLALAADKETEYYAHPMFWAPFVVVGEGGAPVRQ